MIESERPIKRLFLYTKRKTMTGEVTMEMVENGPIIKLFLKWSSRNYFFLKDIFFFFFFLKIVFIYSWETHREKERQRHRQREKQAPCREPDVGLDLSWRQTLNHWATQASLQVAFLKKLWPKSLLWPSRVLAAAAASSENCFWGHGSFFPHTPAFLQHKLNWTWVLQLQGKIGVRARSS